MPTLRRNKRGLRTRQMILAVFIRLVGRTSRLPSVDEIAHAAGCSKRNVYFYFPSRSQLLSAANDYATDRIRSSSLLEIGTGGLARTVHAYVDWWSRTCERHGRLCTVLGNLQRDSGNISPMLRRLAAHRLADIESHFAAELAGVSAKQRHSLVIALETLTDFDSWARLREDRKMTAADIRLVWSSTIARLLASPPLAEGGE